MHTKMRAANLEVTETRRVLQIIRPFIFALGRWNSCVPTHMAVLVSRHTSGLEKQHALAHLKAVLAELGDAGRAFAEATQSSSTHSRVEDVRLSMERLQARISPVVELFEFAPHDGSQSAPLALLHSPTETALELR